ncbi:HEAT repeat domain-containing protein [Natronococcus sp.]|uniref:HEAT repeat domain-containing protein n=1 Tax=Natronococcus sp. TaxID=35747 RepID=UPI0025DF1516|nr:HEAT repeat domain-containing protein [Natronococcus sp.]
MIERLWIAFLGILAATAVVGAGTLVLSILLARFDRRREAARRVVRPAILSRLYRPSPEWATWYEGLSRIERHVARRTVATYLRRLRGREREELTRFAKEVGIDERARSSLSSRLLLNRLRGLVWLALLERPVSQQRLREHCTDRPETRAGAARVVYASNASHADRDGTALLCWDGDERLSVFALDTLYRLNDDDATALLSLAATEGTWWNEELLVQALTVLGHCRAPGSGAGTHLEWIRSLLEHDSPRIRAGALVALSRQGWSRSVRERVPIERAIADPDPDVRTAAYELLGRWNDETSNRWLEYGVRNDPSDRSRLAAARRLSRSDRPLPDSPSDSVERTVAWVRAEHRSPRRVATGWS